MLANTESGVFVSLLLSLLISVAIADQRVFATTKSNDSGQPHLYFFTNPDCRPCRSVEPAIDQLGENGFPVTTINTLAQPDWARHFQVNSTPTVILVSDNRVVGRHSGPIDLDTLRRWFAAVGVNDPASAAGVDSTARSPEPPPRSKSRLSNSTGTQNPSTVHQGTRRPCNEVEQLALQATVRLKVEDPTGISYATGTVIHSHQGEALVLTCGHVFRDSSGQGAITAEFGLETDQPQSAHGQLIYYDANRRDVGLVAIRTGTDITPIKLAPRKYRVGRGDQVFSIGCDHGELPTIRRTRIKNIAAYDGVDKYDIFGRPVDGRSGGGLFTAGGQLIGVCNAAAVEVDEGIYAALDSVYWQFEKVNLAHLFERRNSESRDVESLAAAERLPNPAKQPIGRLPSASEIRGASAANSSRVSPPVRDVMLEATTSGDKREQKTDTEIIFIMRSRTDPQNSRMVTIDKPERQLIEYLEKLRVLQSAERRVDMAQLRRQMPNLSRSPSTAGSSAEFRAQSHR